MERLVISPFGRLCVAFRRSEHWFIHHHPPMTNCCRRVRINDCPDHLWFAISLSLSLCPEICCDIHNCPGGLFVWLAGWLAGCLDVVVDRVSLSLSLPPSLPPPPSLSPPPVFDSTSRYRPEYYWTSPKIPSPSPPKIPLDTRNDIPLVYAT